MGLRSKLHRVSYVYPHKSVADKCVLVSSWDYKYYKGQRFFMYEVDCVAADFFKCKRNENDMVFIREVFWPVAPLGRISASDRKLVLRDPRCAGIESWDHWYAAGISFASYTKWAEADVFLAWGGSDKFYRYTTVSASNYAFCAGGDTFKCGSCRRSKCHGCKPKKYTMPLESGFGH